MYVLGQIAALFNRMLDRRRTRWVEISLAKAWSHDMPARLFDLSDL